MYRISLWTKAPENLEPISADIDLREKGDEVKADLMKASMDLYERHVRERSDFRREILSCPEEEMLCDFGVLIDTWN